MAFEKFDNGFLTAAGVKLECVNDTAGFVALEITKDGVVLDLALTSEDVPRLQHYFNSFIPLAGVLKAQ